MPNKNVPPYSLYIASGSDSTAMYHSLLSSISIHGIHCKHAWYFSEFVRKNFSEALKMIHYLTTPTLAIASPDTTVCTVEYCWLTHVLLKTFVIILYLHFVMNLKLFGCNLITAHWSTWARFDITLAMLSMICSKTYACKENELILACSLVCTYYLNNVLMLLVRRPARRSAEGFILSYFTLCIKQLLHGL